MQMQEREGSFNWPRTYVRSYVASWQMASQLRVVTQRHGWT